MSNPPPMPKHDMYDLEQPNNTVRCIYTQRYDNIPSGVKGLAAQRWATDLGWHISYATPQDGSGGNKLSGMSPYALYHRTLKDSQDGGGYKKRRLRKSSRRRKSTKRKQKSTKRKSTKKRKRRKNTRRRRR